MTHDERSPAEIEREIEARRSDLKSNLEDLQDKFSIDTLVRQIGDQFREHGGDMGRSITNQVKANPVPLALTGIGLAWLMMGSSDQSAYRRPAQESLDGGSTGDDFGRRQSAAGRPYAPPLGHRSRSTFDGGPDWARDDDGFGDPYASGTSAVPGPDRPDPGSSGADETDSSVRDRLAAAGTAVSDRVSAARARLAKGTEELGEAGRARVIAAREKAVDMRRRAAESARSGAETARDFYDEQPLVAGALALAIGAAIGGALPRTRTEDDLMGRQSDDLIAEAERIFSEERDKAARVAGAVGDEIKEIASDAKGDMDDSAPGDSTAVQAVGERAKSAAGRVADKAKAEAKRTKLGKPKA